MSDTLHTKCPHCEATFRINEVQLAQKGGSVRCGSCLQVFRASDHLFTPGGRPLTPAPAARPAKPAEPAKAKVQNNNDEAWAEALLAELDGKPAPVIPPATAATRSAPASTGPGISMRGIETQDRQNDENIVWSPGQAIQSGPVAAPTPAASSARPTPAVASAPAPIVAAPAFTAPAIKPEGNNTRISLGMEELSDELRDMDDRPDAAPKRPGSNSPFDNDTGVMRSITTITGTQQSTADDSWALDMLQELAEPKKTPQGPMALLETEAERQQRERREEVQARQAAKAAPISDDVEHDTSWHDPSLSPSDNAALAGLMGDDDPLDFLNASDTSLDNPFSLEAPPLANIAEPVRVDALPPLHLDKLIAWTLLNVAALLVLLLQYAAYNFDTLARKDNWRPAYETACGVLGCTLPGISDPQRIKVLEVIVREHPGAANGLMLDSLIKNRAPFAQPYPILELVFSDSGNTPLASRRFRPAEYLSGDVKAGDLMPPNTPVHISLALANPGHTSGYDLHPLAN